MAGDYAVVRAKVITKKGREVPADTKMVRRAERWLVYDVLVENIGLIANDRAQFDRIIRTSSYQALVQRMQKAREE